jgi:ribonucleotide reductase alpha subunit
MDDNNVINWLYTVVNDEFYSPDSLSYNYEIDILYNDLKPTSRELFDIEGTAEILSYYESIKNRPFNSTLVIEPTAIYDLINIHTRNHNYIGSYSSFKDSPLNHGKFQFDLWNVTPSDRYDWNTLRETIAKYGARNSLCIAPMPTASTSQILGNNECFEPFTSNIYTRRTIAGEFMLTNKYLIKELTERGIWNSEIKNAIIRDKGSVQNIDEIPDDIKRIFKIVWEIDPTHIVDMARDRGAYICQSQSMNLWVEDPNYKNLTKLHFYGWKQGLKTGIYYLRRKAKHQAQQFTVEPVKGIKNNEASEEVCEMCSG